MSPYLFFSFFDKTRPAIVNNAIKEDVVPLQPLLVGSWGLSVGSSLGVSLGSIDGSSLGVSEVSPSGSWVSASKTQASL